jgi:hypothetical protein
MTAAEAEAAALLPPLDGAPGWPCVSIAREREREREGERERERERDRLVDQADMQSADRGVYLEVSAVCE